jgi:dienelactone hydrolase
VESRVVHQGRVALLASILGCSSASGPTAPVRPAPITTPAYTLGGLTIEGAPPLSQALAVRRDERDAKSARLLDLAVLDPAYHPLALVGSGGNCFVGAVTPQLSTGTIPSPKCVTTWARLTESTPVFLRDFDDESGALGIGPQDLSPIGVLSDPVLDRAHGNVFYGFAVERPAELWVSSLAGGGGKAILGNGPWAPLDVSRDGAFVLARRELSSARAGLYLIEVATATAVALTDPDELVTRAKFVGSDVLMVVERDGRRILEYATPRWRRPIALDGDVFDFAIATRGIVAITETAGISTLRLIDPVSGPRVIVEAPEGGVIRDLFAVDDTIAFTFSDATRPAQVQFFELGDHASPIAHWPDSRVAGAAAELHEVTARDGVTFQVLAYPPRSTPAPVILELHGGPEDRWLPKYDRFVDLATSEGYAVVRPNVRGSAGQGRAFMALDDGERRDTVLRDVEATLDWIATQPNFDASRVVVMGTSYGGYLALSALHAFPDRLRGGITLSAITDLPGFLDGTAPYRRDHRRAEYGDERDPQTRTRLAKLSPIAWVGELKRPLLMAYGQKDPRVPPLTAARFLTGVRAAGVPLWSMVASDEGHWFERPENRRAFEVLALQFAASCTAGTR